MQQVVQVNAPDLIVMAVAGIFAPNMLDAFIGESGVEGSTAIDRVVLGPGAEEDYFVILVRLCRVRQEFGRGERLGAGASTETANVGEEFGMTETDGGALAAAHRITEDRPAFFSFEDAKFLFDVGNHVAEQIFFHVTGSGRIRARPSPAEGATTTETCSAGRRSEAEGALESADFRQLAA